MKSISIENIYWMIAYAFRSISEKDIINVGNEKFENIYDLFSVMMTQELNRQIKRGINKEYIETRDELSLIKGKVILNDLMKQQFKKKAKVSCEFDDYSVNSYLNQIVKTACCYLIRSGKIKDKSRANKLKKALLFLNEVNEINPKFIKWNAIKYNKFSASYKILVNISYLIFEGLLISKNDGEFEYRDYIDDQKMHKLYEKFILEYYRYHYSELRPKDSQVEWDVDDKNEYIYLLPKMQTDITLYKDDRELIIDAKYWNSMYQSNPMYNKETFISGNLYQIYTYVKNADKNGTGKVSGILLYVKTDDNDKQYADYLMGNNKIIVCNLDMSVDFEYVKNQLNKIADSFITNTL